MLNIYIFFLVKHLQAYLLNTFKRNAVCVYTNLNPKNERLEDKSYFRLGDKYTIQNVYEDFFAGPYPRNNGSNVCLSFKEIAKTFHYLPNNCIYVSGRQQRTSFPLLATRLTHKCQWWSLYIGGCGDLMEVPLQWLWWWLWWSYGRSTKRAAVFALWYVYNLNWKHGYFCLFDIYNYILSKT